MIMMRRTALLYVDNNCSNSNRSVFRDGRRRPQQQQQHNNKNQISFLYQCVVILMIAIMFNVMDPSNYHHKHHPFGIMVVHGMKHTFTVDRTSRTIIGPIGIPFGFNPNGFYQLTVSNFQLQWKPMRKGNAQPKASSSTTALSKEEQTEMLESHYEAGFYLQRYDTIASFHQHYNKLVNNIQNYYNRTGTSISSSSSSSSTHQFTATTIQDTCSFAHWLSDDILTNAGNNNHRRQLQHQSHQHLLQAVQSNDDAIVDDDLPLSNMDDLPVAMRNDGNDNDVVDTDDDELLQSSNKNNYPNDDMNIYGGTDDNEDDGYNDHHQNSGEDDLTVPLSPTTAAVSTNNNDDEVYYQQNSKYSLAQPHGIYMSMHSISHTWKPHQPQINYTFQVGEEGLYFLMYQICPYPSSDMKIFSTFTLDIEHYNIDAWGHRSYLSAGEMKLPLLYLFFTMSYILCFGIWYTNIRSIQRGQYGHFYKPINQNDPRPVVHLIHPLMSLVIILKFISVLLESVQFYFKKVRGRALGWSILYNFVSCINVFFFFTVLVLLGTGWSIITPFIEGRIKYMIVLVILLQVLNNIAILVLSQETDGETNYQTWLGLLHIVDLLCCAAIVVPIVWQISTLEKNAGLFDDDVAGTLANSSAEDDANGVSPWRERVIALESGRMDPILEKLKLFRTFYLVVVGYIYSTRILIYLFTSILSYRFVWVENFIIELITLTFYVTVGILFRPVPEVEMNHRTTNGVHDDDDVISVTDDERQSLTKSDGRYRTTGSNRNGNSGGIELRSLPPTPRSVGDIKKV